MKLLDWAGRVVMLVLAGMVTLSIIGAIAAIPSGTIPPRLGIRPDQPSAPPEARPAEQRQRDETGRHSRPDRVITQEVGKSGAAPAAPETSDAARWLEAITYSLLALVGLAALACLLLWRGLHERRRIADSLESLARTSP